MDCSTAPDRPDVGGLELDRNAACPTVRLDARQHHDMIAGIEAVVTNTSDIAIEGDTPTTKSKNIKLIKR
jgi:hypothetical protein